MWLERTLIATAAAFSILAIVCRPLTSMSPAVASSLRGGQAGWCTEHFPASTCETCIDDINCSNGGTQWGCQGSTDNICQECVLGNAADCFGFTQVFLPGNCPNGPAIIRVPGCDTYYYPNACSLRNGT